MPAKNTEADFFKRLVIVDSGCIEWDGALDRNGYGIFYYANKNIFAHRFSFSLANGEIPKGLMVCHRCDNPKCVNADHLFLGSAYDNAIDCINKKRANKHKGESHHRAKLTEENIIFIRTSKMKQIDMAKMFAVSQAAISFAKRGINWPHIGSQK